MKVAIVADGDPRVFSTNSGVALGILTGLERDRRVAQVVPVDGSVPRALRLPLAAATVRPGRRWWWSNFNLGLLNLVTRAAVAGARLRKHEVDLTVYVRNIHLPTVDRYALFIDTTTAIADRSWRSWKTTPILSRVRRAVERRAFVGATRIFTAGEQTARSVIEEYGIPESRVRAVGGGVNFDPVPEPALLHSSDLDERVILFVGADFERKGGDLLVEAFEIVRRHHPDVRLVIVGPPAKDVPSVEGVSALGKISDREVLAQVYSAAYAFCLPSRHEPYGLVLQEAMAFGLPCIAADVGAISTIVVNRETGLLVPPGALDDLVSALDALLTDPGLARSLGAAGRRRAISEYTWSAVAERMLNSVGISEEVSK